MNSQAVSRPDNQRRHCHYHQSFHSHCPHQLNLLYPFQARQYIHLIAHLFQRHIAVFELSMNFLSHQLMCEETLNSLRRCSLKEAGGCGTYSDKGVFPTSDGCPLRYVIKLPCPACSTDDSAPLYFTVSRNGCGKNEII